MTRTRGTMLAIMVLAVVGVLAITLTDNASGQTEPPFGEGDWVVRDVTTITNRDLIMLDGDLLVTGGGSLTLSNTTLLFMNDKDGDHTIRVEQSSALRIISGSMVGSYRPGLGYLFQVQAGCTLRILDSDIDECGSKNFGFVPDWSILSLFIETNDTVIEGSSFTGGLAGPYFAEGIIASPVRNCTFENSYGVITWGTDVEDCTFRHQAYYGVVIMGGTEANVRRCSFVDCVSTSAQVGYQLYEPPMLWTATGTIEDCTFLHCTRGVRVLEGSTGTVKDCVMDGIDREGIHVVDDGSATVLDGQFHNCTVSIGSDPSTQVSWTVTERAFVQGGNVTLTGDLELKDQARLELREFRELIFLSHGADPKRLVLGSGAHLLVVNGTIGVPPDNMPPKDWAPFILHAPGGLLELRGVDEVNVSFPVSIGALVARDSTITMGTWRVGTLDLHSCDLVAETGGHRPAFIVGSADVTEESTMTACRLDRIPAGGGNAQPWLVIERGTVRSEDFLSRIQDLLDNGELEFPNGNAEAQLTVWWSMQARVHWQNQVPIEGAQVTITDGGSGLQVDTLTAHDGLTPVVMMMTEEGDGSGEVSSYLPLTLRARKVNLGGETQVDTADAPLSVDITILDDIAPGLILDQGFSIATNISVLNLTGQVSDSHSGVAFLEYSQSQASYLRVTRLTDEGLFNITVSLTEGLQTVSFRVYDKVGNRRQVIVEVYFSTSEPSIIVESPEDGTWVNSELVYIVGQTEANSTVEAGGRRQFTENGTFRILVTLKEGPNLFDIQVTNRAGNKNNMTLLLFLDTQPPELLILRPSPNPLDTNNSKEDILGRTDPGAEVFINSVQMDVDENGRFSGRLSLDEGTNTAKVTARDISGNSVSIDIVFRVDSRPPQITVLVNGRDATEFTDDGVLMTSAATVLLTIVTDNNTLLSVDGVDVQLTGDLPQVTYEMQYTVTEGFTGISVRVEDMAGNVQIFGQINVDVDRTPPRLVLDSSVPNGTEEALITLRGATEPNVTVLINGVRLPVDIYGAFTRNFLLSEGINHLVIIATDQYGQSSTVVHDVTMTPSVPPPTEGPSSRVPFLILLTIVVLAVEAIVLKWWWSRRGGTESGE